MIIEATDTTKKYISSLLNTDDFSSLPMELDEIIEFAHSLGSCDLLMDNLYKQLYLNNLNIVPEIEDNYAFVHGREGINIFLYKLWTFGDGGDAATKGLNALLLSIMPNITFGESIALGEKPVNEIFADLNAQYQFRDNVLCEPLYILPIDCTFSLSACKYFSQIMPSGEVNDILLLPCYPAQTLVDVAKLNLLREVGNLVCTRLTQSLHGLPASFIDFTSRVIRKYPGLEHTVCNKNLFMDLFAYAANPYLTKAINAKPDLRRLAERVDVLGYFGMLMSTWSNNNLGRLSFSDLEKIL